MTGLATGKARATCGTATSGVCGVPDRLITGKARATSDERRYGARRGARLAGNR